MIAREIPYYNLLLCLNALRIKIPRLVKYEIASYIGSSGSKYQILGLHFPPPATVNLQYPGDYEKYDLSPSYLILESIPTIFTSLCVQNHTYLPKNVIYKIIQRIKYHIY